MNRITINGKNIGQIMGGNAGNVSITNGKIFVNGKEFQPDDDEKIINIHIEGDVSDLKVDNCEKLTISGNCGSADSQNGNITVAGDVQGNVTTVNGNVSSGNIGGKCMTVNGNIRRS